MMERISRRNTLLAGPSCVANSGLRIPATTPAAIPIKIQAVSEMRFISPQRAEQKRRDDGTDQPQEHVAGGTQLRGELRLENPGHYPRGHSDKDPGGERNALHRPPHFNFWRNTSKNIMRGGRISSSECWELRQTTVSPSSSGRPTWPSMVRNTVSPSPCEITRITLVSETI